MSQAWPDDDWWYEAWDGSDCTDPACDCRDVDVDASSDPE